MINGESSIANPAVRHLALPPQRFYWAMLDAAQLPPRRRRDAQSLGFLFENVLPVSIEDVQAIYRTTRSRDISDGDGGATQGESRILACALSKDDLRTLLKTQHELVVLSPERLPSAFDDPAIDPHSLNLLTGEFEPPGLTRGKRWITLHAAIIALCVLALLIAGLERRTALWRQQAGAIRSAQQQLIIQTLESSPAASRGQGGRGDQPLDLRMLAELRTLRQTRQQPLNGSSTGVVDATPTLATLVEHWPRDLHLQTESISITPTAMTVRGLAPTSGDVQTLADALGALPGWQLQQPQISAAPPNGVNASLQWKREPAPPVPAPLATKEGAS